MKDKSNSKDKPNLKSRRGFLRTVGASAAAFGMGAVLNPKLFKEENSLISLPSQKNNLTTMISTQGESNSSATYKFNYFIGIVGSPSDPDISWSDNELMKIKDLGVNMLQLSIAWGGRPANEVLNLEDLDSSQIAKWEFRIKQAKKFGFSTIAQFGVPKLQYTANAYSIVQPACILSPEIRKKYAKLLGNFLDRFPSVDNVLLYTYDQNAWLCSEFGPCPRCSGIPLYERLSGFLDFLNNAMQKHHNGVTLWWKPWEISNGTTIKIVQNIKSSHFGLILNPSCANEVYPFNDRAFSSDLGIKRTVQVAADRNIPVIGEFDYTFYKGYYQLADFFPRFVYEQIKGWKAMKGVVGIKEYFGFAPSQFSVNAAMLQVCMKSPDASLDELLKEIVAPYGEDASKHMKDAWEKIARGVEAFPWDVSPSFVGLNKSDDGSHPWDPVTISNDTWATPAWKTNRRAYYMLANEFKAHPWVFEDMGLQLEESADLLDKAVSSFDKAIVAGSAKVSDIQTQRQSIAKMASAIRGKSLHFLETLAAQDARLVGYDENQLGIVTKRLENFLEKDVENQGHAPEVVQKLNEFRKDPKTWLQNNLNPLAYESKCAIDWNIYTPYASRQD